MADICLDNKLNQDILKSCDLRPKAGLEVDMVAILWDDIDWSATTFDATNKMLVTNLALKTGKTGYKIQGFKVSNNLNFEKQTDDIGSGYQHKIAGVLANPTAANRYALYSLLNEERYVFVVERKWKGENKASAFLMIGKDNGITGSTHTYGSAENNGMEIFEMTTPEGELERYPALSLLHTDYDTTKGAFDNKFHS